MANKDLLIDIKANTKNYLKGINQVKGANKGVEKSMKSMLSMQKFQTAVMGFNMIKGAISGVVNKVKKYVQVYENQMMQERKLEALLRNRGEFTNQMFTKHLAFARQLQKESNFGDEQIINLTSQFQTFTNISQETAMKATKATADIATVTGQNLTSVGIQLGKALSEPLKMASSLRRSGVMFDMEKLKSFNTLAKRQAYLLSEIQKQYGGASKGAISELKQFENAFGDVQEKIGKNLMPLFRELKTGMLVVMGVVADVTGWFKNLFSTTTDVANSVKELNVTLAETEKDEKKIQATQNLVDKYQTLQKEGKNTDAVIQQIAKTVPQAVTAFDAQGKAIKVNIDVIKQYNKQMGKIASSKLQAQFGKTIKEAGKALRNFASLRTVQKLEAGEKIKGSDVDFSNISAVASTEDQARVATEMSKLAKNYDTLYTSALKVKNLDNEHIQVLYNLAKQTGRTKASLESYKFTLNAISAAFNYLSSSAIKGFSSLSLANKKRAAQLVSETNVMADLQGRAKGNAQAIVNAVKAQQEAIEKKNKAEQQSIANAEKYKNAYAQLIAYIEKLQKIGKTKLQIELDNQAKEFFKHLKIGKKAQVKIKAELDKQDFEKAAQLALKNTPRYILKQIEAKGIDPKKLITDKFAKHYKKTIQKANEEIAKTAQTFITNADTGYFAELKKIQNEYAENRKKILEAELKLEKNKNRLTDEQYKKLKSTLGLAKEAIEKQQENKALAQHVSFIKDFTTTSNNLISSIKSLNKSIMKGSVGGVLSGVGSLTGNISGMFGKLGFEKFGQVGSAVQSVLGFVGGLASMFEDGGISARQIWEENFNFLTSRLEYELRQQQEILRTLEQQEQLVNYINKLSGLATTSAEKNFLEQLQYQETLHAYEQASKYTIGGKQIQDMSTAELIAAYQEAQTETSQIEDVQALAKLYASRTPDRSALWWIAQEQSNSQAWQDWEEFKNLISPYMTTNVGGPAWGAAQDYLEAFMTESEHLIDLQSTSLDVLEQYAELESEIAETEAERYNTNLKISEELYNQLRALGNQNIDKILDQAEQLEEDIQLGIIREGSAEAEQLRTQYLNQLMNLLGQQGETGLASDVQLARADYYSSADQEGFLQRAGLGNIVQLDRGGLITKSGLANVHENELIMNKDMLKAMQKGNGNAINLGGIQMNFEGGVTAQDAERISNVVYDSIARKLNRANLRIV